MPAQITEWTAEMARALPDDGQRYEVLDGQLAVTPAPSSVHQRAVLQFAVRLHEYVLANHLGECMICPADIEFSQHRLLQPDVFVVPRDLGRVRNWRDVTSLHLAIEVLSPTAARADRIRKRLIYQNERVPEYWIIDLDARLVERWRPDDERPELVSELLAWQPHPGVEPLSIDLAAFFAGMLD